MHVSSPTRRRARTALVSSARSSLHAAALALVTLCASATAQHAPPGARELPGLGGGHPAVLLDRAPDGTQWVLANTYKARFDATGARIAPKLGVHAPRALSLELGAPRVSVDGRELALDAQALPTAIGERIEYDRGALVERWDLGLAALEHSFVLHASPGAGALALRIPLGGELGAAGRGAGADARVHANRDANRDAGLRFGDAAGLVYGDALARDARGAELALPVRVENGAIAIDVPASYMASARYPLVIDPLVSTFGVDQTSSADLDSDLAFDAGKGVWLVVYQETIAADDHDIVCRRLSASGGLFEEVGVDLTNDDTCKPRVAHNAKASQFLIVWDKQGLNSKVRARTRAAGSTSQGTPFDVSGFGLDEELGVVGGNDDPASDDYLVAWVRASAIPAHSGYSAALVTTAGVVKPKQVDVDFLGASVSQLSINRARKAGGKWLLAYADIDFCPGICEGDIYALPVGADGAPIGFVQPIEDSSSFDDDRPVVAGDGEHFLVAWQRETSAGTHSIQGAFLDVTPSFVNLSGTLNLSQAETGNQTKDRIDVALAGDGGRFTYAYRERASGSNYDVYLATCAFGPSLAFQEKHVAVIADATNDDDPRIACTCEGGGAPGEYMGSWSRVFGASSSDIDGFLYDGLGNGGVKVAQNGCGGFLEPALSLVGAPILGTSVDLSLSGAGTPLLLFGLHANPGLPLCATQGGCELGVFPIVSQLATAAQSFAIPVDLGLLGAKVAFQGVRLNPNPPSGGCGPSVWPIAFRMSDTLLLTFE